jgi:hypothetical protein
MLTPLKNTQGFPVQNRFAAATIFLTTAFLIGDRLRAAEAAPAEDVVFARDIQPLLAKHCLLCHGPDEAEAGLRLDLSEQAYAELDSGERAIVPGDADASGIVRRISTTDESTRMPPEGDPLSEQDVERIRRWIDAGANYEVHWAYRSVKKPELPKVKNETWCRNPIDRFVLARLEQNGLAPSAEAERAVLIKRLYYDLIGLPPPPQQVDAFVDDDAADAYERLVDRLLDSQSFGERWARHWLDKARYADSDGYEKDRPRMNAWRYRDWVIDAVNRDLPFDQFSIQQLAGDLLDDASPTEKLATAFHRQTLTNTEGGVDQEEFRIEATFDRTETTGAVWMGLTMTCARCHSHKYDQITQREYYQMFAFFNSASETNVDVPQSDEALERYHRQKQTHDEQVAALTEKYEAAKRELQPEVEKWMREMSDKLAAAAEAPLQFNPVRLIEGTAASGATLVAQEDDSLLVTGDISDKDKYTLVVEPPEQPLTGLRLEAITHDSLEKKGPGRAPNGNFVLSELRAYVSDDREFKDPKRIELVGAEADFAQKKFAPEGAFSSKDKSGWAISPQMGKGHQITFYCKEPLQLNEKQFLQIVLDQQYGGQHTIGRFRVSIMSGSDPLNQLPKEVAEAVGTGADKRSAKQRDVIADHVASLDTDTAKLAGQLANLKKQAPPSVMMSVRVMAPESRTTKLLHRGDFLQPADEVSADTLALIHRTHPLKSRHADRPADRLDLASWLLDEHHPLTPRVTVNHVWAHLFGRGIVATLNDFGVRGEMPTHPELLDWLAWQLPREMRWSRKTLIKTIVMSATYRQSSYHRPELQSVDPTNRLLARQNRLRVEAEVVRDLYLAVSGLLSGKVGGPSVFPPLPSGVADLSYNNNFKWKTSDGEDRYRRGMYTFFKRTSPHPTLISFDCPDSNTSRLERDASNTPLQALTTLNNDVFVEAAQGMAQRVLTEAGADDNERLTYALRLCIARQPDDAEVGRFADLLDLSRTYYKAHPDEATQTITRHAADEVTPEENAAWVATMRIVLNLDEFIVRD